MNIVFCLPGRSFSNEFLKSWSKLLQYLPQYGINPILSSHYNSVVYYVRNQCLGGNVLRGKNQLPFDGKVDYDYIMWIDSDIVFEVDDFIKLLNMNKNIASGIYKTSDNIHFATVEKWDKDNYIKNGSFKFLTEDDIKTKTQPFSVDYTGFGWTLIKKGVFESMKYPWFRPIWEDFGSDITEFSSEDVGFCKTAKGLGYNIYVNPDIIVGHEKMKILR
jgi:hypothetical protein